MTPDEQRPPPAPARPTCDDLLHRLRPRATSASAWDETTQHAVLATILAEDPPTPIVSFPTGPVSALVACAAATVPLAFSIGLPIHAPGGASPAAALDRLATIASATGPAIGAGQYLHRTYVTDVPYVAGVPMTPGAVRHGDRAVSTRSHGRDRTRCGSCRPAPTRRPCLDVVPLRRARRRRPLRRRVASQLATLPTEPTQLATYIDEHPDGGNRGTVNTYTAVTTSCGRHCLAAAALGSAQRLGTDPGLSGNEHTTDDQGRPAIRIDHDANGGTRVSLVQPHHRADHRDSRPHRGRRRQHHTHRRQRHRRTTRPAACAPVT